MICTKMSDAESGRDRDQASLIERYPILAPMIAAADALGVNEAEALSKYLSREVERFVGKLNDM